MNREKKVATLLSTAAAFIFYLVYLFIGVTMCAKEHIAVFKQAYVMLGLLTVITMIVLVFFYDRTRTVLIGSVLILLLISCAFQTIFTHYYPADSFSITESVCDAESDTFRITKLYHCSYCGKEKSVKTRLEKDSSTNESNETYYTEGGRFYQFDEELGSFVYYMSREQEFSVKAIPALMKQALGAPILALIEQLALAALLSLGLLFSLEYLLPKSRTIFSCRMLKRRDNIDADGVGGLCLIAGLCTVMGLCAVGTHILPYTTFFNELLRLCYVVLTSQIILLQRNGYFDEGKQKWVFLAVNAVPFVILLLSFFLVGETGFTVVAVLTGLLMKVLFLRRTDYSSKLFLRYVVLTAAALGGCLVLLSITDFSAKPQSELLKKVITAQTMLNSRLELLFDPVHATDGNQIVIAQEALALGRLTGVSTPDILSIPYAENDMAIIYVGLSWGLLGILIVLTPLLVFFFAALKTVLNRCREDDLTGLFLAGALYMLTIQMLLQLLGCVGASLFSGVGIPFISQGSSDFIICTAIALCVIIRSFPGSNKLFHKALFKRKKVLSDE